MDENLQASTPDPTTRTPRRVITAVVAAAVVAAVGVGGIAVVGGTTRVPSPTTTASRFAPWGGVDRAGGPAAGSTLQGGGASTGILAATRPATTAEAVGVVDITTVLDYGTGAAAGTGVVLTPSGEILTNNHVVDGATSISVTDVATGRTYTASVVGTDPADDVAVIQLVGASGLAPARLASAAQGAAVAVGDAVTAVGNAGGTGGTPTAAPGTVAALNQDITAGDGTAAGSEQLTGLIAVDAAIRSGDSGGPLYDGGVVIGIDTAADSGGTVGFAIPITTATALAGRIVAGEDSTTIHRGTPAFLGVQLSGTGAAVVAGVLAGSPAATAGLRTGDTITAVGGVAVSGAQALSTVLATHEVGQSVRVGWSDANGASHTATVVLAAGPAD